MIRGAVYPVDLGDAQRGYEQRGRRLGVVISIEQNASCGLVWSRSGRSFDVEVSVRVPLLDAARA